MKQISLSIFLIILFYSCKVDPKINAPLPSDNIAEIIPEGWPKPNYTFSTNTVSEAKFILGRALFYENKLSKNDSISCGSCHLLFVAFAHAGHKVSHGIREQVGNRNAPGIFNMTWHTSFMHDGGINHLELQPLAPIANPIEMDENIVNVIAKLQASEKYKTLFKNAFGSEEVSSQKMLLAMAQFQGLIYSYNSKFDSYKRGETAIQLNEAEARGYSLFQAKCNACHTEPLFSDFNIRSNGLAVDPFYKDSGRYRITNLASDIYKFKTPSLRNIAKTGPYMHDGRFTTLKQCLDHYTGGITNMTNIDPLLAGGTLGLSEQDKNDIIAFLETLTDYKLLTDKRFADPNN